jgi:hypothetical protein
LGKAGAYSSGAFYNPPVLPTNIRLARNSSLLLKKVQNKKLYFVFVFIGGGYCSDSGISRSYSKFSGAAEKYKENGER